MPKEELMIRIPQKNAIWQDAYDTWGVSLEETALSRLMTPAPVKAPVDNKSELEHGKRVKRDVDNVKVDERSVTLVINICAPTPTEFMNRYAAFCHDVLYKGFMDLKTRYSPDVYRMTYVDCTQFQEWAFDVAAGEKKGFGIGIGKYTLSLNEPNPHDRGEVSEDEQDE